jgi:hypothetical protein
MSRRPSRTPRAIISTAAASGSLLVSCSALTSFDGFTGGVSGSADAQVVPDAMGARDGTDGAASDVRFGDDASSADRGPVADSGGVAPIAFVQSGETDRASNGIVSFPFGKDVTAHDAIIVSVSVYSTSVTLSSVRDTVGNAYMTVMGPLDGNGTRHYIALALDIAAGPDTVTATLSANPAAYLALHIHEYSGLAASGAFDVGSFNTGTSTATDGMQSGSKTTTADHELIFGYAISLGSMAPGTGFTARTGFETGDITEDEFVTTRGSYQATATMTSGSAWEMLMATFKAQ